MRPILRFQSLFCLHRCSFSRDHSLMLYSKCYTHKVEVKVFLPFVTIQKFQAACISTEDKPASAQR